MVYYADTAAAFTPSGQASALPPNESPSQGKVMCTVVTERKKEMCHVVKKPRLKIMCSVDREKERLDCKAAYDLEHKQQIVQSPPVNIVTNGFVSSIGAPNYNIPAEILGNFNETPNGLYCGNELVINACVRIVDIIHSVGTGESAGKEDRYECTVFFKGKALRKIISATDFVSGKWLTKIGGVAWMNVNLIRRYLNALVIAYNGTETYDVDRPGWIDLNGNGSMAYVCKNGIIGDVTSEYPVRCSCGVDFGAIVGDTFAPSRYIRYMMSLTPNASISVVIMLYLVQSVLFKLFKTAGFVPIAIQ